MQSILQYKRFGKHARDQYERDRKRAEALEKGNAENEESAETVGGGRTGHRRSSVDETESPDSRDPEKAEQPGTEGLGADGRDDGGEVQRGSTADTLKTTQSFGTKMGHALTGIEVRQLSKKLTKTRTKRSGRMPTNEKGEERETVFVVGYESENDPMNPHRWSLWARIRATVLIAAIGFIVGFASSIDSAALKQASAEFGVSDVTESLATGLFLVGFGFGALVSV
jgi:hypothetical protein